MCIGALIVIPLLAIAFVMKDLRDFIDLPPFDKEPGRSFHADMHRLTSISSRKVTGTLKGTVVTQGEVSRINDRVEHL